MRVAQSKIVLKIREAKMKMPLIVKYRFYLLKIEIAYFDLTISRIMF